MDYQPRIVDDRLSELLDAMPAVLIEGARAVGKTETARRVRADEMLLEDPDIRDWAWDDPFAAVVGWREPLLVDEWPLAGSVFDGVRRQVDADSRSGRFVLTGSTHPAGITAHPGTGRIVTLRMRPMTLPERGVADPQVSLASLLERETASVAGRTDFEPADYAMEIGLSGFPGIRRHPGRSGQQLAEYMERVIQSDIEVSGRQSRKPDSLRRWLAAFAAATATAASLEKIRAAAAREDGSVPGRNTALAYYEALHSLWLIDDLPGWMPSEKKLSQVNRSPKHYLADPALALMLLNRNAHSLLLNRELFGRLFESLATLSLRVFAGAIGARVYHLRTKGGRQEVDVILETGEGRVLALEAKLSRVLQDGDCDHLHWLRTRLGSRWIGGAVINTGPYAYRRRDGIAVIPLAMLGP